MTRTEKTIEECEFFRKQINKKWATIDANYKILGTTRFAELDKEWALRKERAREERARGEEGCSQTKERRTLEQDRVKEEERLRRQEEKQRLEQEALVEPIPFSGLVREMKERPWVAQDKIQQNYEGFVREKVDLEFSKGKERSLIDVEKKLKRSSIGGRILFFYEVSRMDGRRVDDDQL